MGKGLTAGRTAFVKALRWKKAWLCTRISKEARWQDRRARGTRVQVAWHRDELGQGWFMGLPPVHAH